MHRLIVIWLGKFVALALRLSGRGGGSALPGLVVERLCPEFLANSRGHFDKIILICGTNGKTTTTKMLKTILEADGQTVLSNGAGSNMPRGIISSIVAATDRQGSLQFNIGLFEVDEGFAPQVAEALLPDIIVLLNLHRDQLDRYGELNRTAQLLAEAAEFSRATVINRDDPLLAELGASLTTTPEWFGAAAAVRHLLPSDDELHQSSVKKITHQQHQASVVIKAVSEQQNHQVLDLVVKKATYKVKLPLKGVYNAYNAAAAFTTAHVLGNEDKQSAKALTAVKPAFGRSELLELEDKRYLQILLVKNPSGFNQVITSHLANNNSPVLIAINDNYADGRDVSWLWDVNFEQNAESKDKSRTGQSGSTANPFPITTTGARAADMSLRLAYAEIESECQPDLVTALDGFIERLKPGQTGLIVPTYTAMLGLRRLLSNYTEVGDWE